MKIKIRCSDILLFFLAIMFENRYTVAYRCKFRERTDLIRKRVKIPRGAAAVKGSLYKNVTGSKYSGKAVQSMNLSQNTCLRRCFRYFTRIWREAEI